MATRLSRYASSYSANVRAVERYKSIQDTVKDEQDRQAAVQSYLVAERSNLTNLEQVFAARPTQDGLATEILKQGMAADAAAYRNAAARKAATGAKGKVPASVVTAMNKDPQKGAVAAGNAADAAATALAKTGKDALSAADAAATLAYLRTIPSMPPARLANAEKQAAKVTERPAARAGVKPPTPEELAADRGLKAATEAIYFGSPQGYAGGFDGEAIAQSREKIAAPEGSKFTTGDEAYKAYLSMLDDGSASVEELASITGQEDPALAAAEFAFASKLYSEAKINKAYTNADRKYFEPAWLEQAKRVAELQNEYNETKKSYGGRTPAQEAAYRELKARGIDPDDPHAQYAGTPTHGYLMEADRIYGQTIGAGSKLVPSTYVQKKTAALIDQYAASGTEWKVKDIEKQLGKAFEGKNLTDAVAFALVYDRVKTEGATPESQAALQVEEEKRKANAARENEAKLKKLEEEEIAARALQKRTEQQLGRAMRSEDANERARVEYARQRALGKSEEEARAIALPLIPPKPAPMTEAEKADAALNRANTNIKASAAQRAIQDIPMKSTPEVLAGPDDAVPPTPGTDVIGPPPVEAPVTSPRRRNRQVNMPTTVIAGTVPATAPVVKASDNILKTLKDNEKTLSPAQKKALLDQYKALQGRGE
jgi:hypothetical protein